MTDYTADNDYTLRVEDTHSSEKHYARSLTRVFNFKAAQVTTIYHEWISGTAGNTVTSQMNVQNFADVQSQDEIREMHTKLKELGGNPPALDDTLPKKQLKQPFAP